MRRAIAIIVSCAIVFAGCASAQTPIVGNQNNKETTALEMTTEETLDKQTADVSVVSVDNEKKNLEQTEEVNDEIETESEEKLEHNQTSEVKFDHLDDEDLLPYLEDTIYKDLVEELKDEDYFVENVQAVYLSQEYIDELAYNSQSNVFFGYTLDEIENEFGGTRYIFTVGDDGQTVVKELEEVTDDTYEKVIKNVAIGTGVVLVCVTVSVATAGVAPAVSVIFATAASTGTAVALQSGGIAFAAAGIARGYQTHDFDEALKAGALAGSEGFKVGAITGAVTGGVTETVILKKATLSGLTMNEAALLQRETDWPVEIIKQLHSYKEYEVYKNAHLMPVRLNGEYVMIPSNMDLSYVSKLPDGTEVTNLVRMQREYSPIDPVTGKAYQLHHIGQKSDGTLAILTESQHQGNAAVLNIPGKASEIDRNAFAPVRKKLWKTLGDAYANGGF